MAITPTHPDDVKKPDQATDQAAGVAAPKIKLPEPSKGEKVYNWIVYRGINYWGNLALSIAIAEFFLDRGGKPYMEKGDAYFKENWKPSIDKLVASGRKMLGLKESVKEALQPGKEQKGMLTAAALTSGGWVLLPPMKFLEDRKSKVVYWLNEKLGVKQVGPDGHKLTADEIYLEHKQPEQPWWRVIGRRSLGTAVVLTTGKMVDKIYDQEKLTEFLLKGHDGKRGITKAIGYIGGNEMAHNPRVQTWLKYGLLDSVYTQITAWIMWATNGSEKMDKSQVAADKLAKTIAQHPEEYCPPGTDASTAPHTDRTASKRADFVPTENYKELAKKDTGGLTLGSQ